MFVEACYVAYLVITIAMTIWVAHTLSTNGRVFLVDAFANREDIADSVNHMLVVGFYLMNLGFVTLALRYGARPTDLASAIEVLSTKVGLAMLVLGAMHFLLMHTITRWGRSAVARYEGSSVAVGGGGARVSDAS